MLRRNVFVVLFMVFFHVSSRPTDEIKKITLDTPKEIINSTNLHVPTKWEKGMELLGQIMDAMRFGTGRLVNYAMLARNAIAERAEEFTSDAANKVVAVIAARDARKIIQNTQKRSTSVSSSSSRPKRKEVLDISFPSKTRETVRLETEAGQSLFEIKKPKPVEGYLQKILSPIPIVDKINEQDKYGNSGDKFIGVGRAIVNGFEGLSNFLNAVVDFPGNAAKKTSQKLTEALNQVGAKLVGLE